MNESRSVSVDLLYSKTGVDIVQTLSTNKLPLSGTTVSESSLVLFALRKTPYCSLISERVWRQLELGDNAG
jgi:hypothetical protein